MAKHIHTKKDIEAVRLIYGETNGLGENNRQSGIGLVVAHQT